MSNFNFNVDIKGRVRNFDLAIKDALMPIYEAVVNSLQSISESETNEDKFINVYVKRHSTYDDGQFENSYIKNVIIEDNGVGFTNDNFKSFLTSDSPLKYKMGGKGIGRFTWLKTFSTVRVSSVFYDNNKKMNRVFDFKLEDTPIENYHLDELNSDSPIITKIELKNLKEEYSRFLDLSLEIIANRIMNHIVPYLIGVNCPRISIEDGVKTIIINEKFEREINTSENIEKVIVGEHELNILHTKVFNSQFEKHNINYCGNSRVVKSVNLESNIPNLVSKLSSSNEEYIYVGYVLSEYLDKNVDSNRTKFNITKKKNKKGMLNTVSMDEIETEIVKSVKKYLEKELSEIQKKKMCKFEDFVNNEEPRFRHLFSKYSEKISDLSPNISKKKLITEFSLLQSEFKHEIEKDKNIIMNQNSTTNERYHKLVRNYLEKVDEYNKSTLTEYVIRRKSIIDILERQMGCDAKGKYALESHVHNLLFPMNSSSDTVSYDDHNLWLVDEKLSFHQFLTSDLKLNPNDKSSNRPDILIGHTYTETDDKPYRAITIIELKRPDRHQYTDEYNPISQMLKYVQDIQKGDKKDAKGRTINTNEKTRFYLYAICDITEKIENFILTHDYTKTPDELGYFGINKNLNAYIEVISFDQLLQNAKKRNKIMFNKLGLE